MEKFLDSNSITSLTTLVVGLFAFIIYYKQKVSFKRDAASLILQEIRYAEQQVRIAKDTLQYGFSLSIILLPTNNWNNNIHLFINNLEQNDIDLISKFYADARYLDRLISKISELKESEVLPIPPEEPSPTEKAFMAQKILIECTHKFEFIYNTPVTDKLRKIAKNKEFLIF